MIQTALGGSAVNVFYGPTGATTSPLRFDPRFRDQVDDIANLPVALPGGHGSIPLGGRPRWKQGRRRIQREAGSRCRQDQLRAAATRAASSSKPGKVAAEVAAGRLHHRPGAAGSRTSSAPWPPQADRADHPQADLLAAVLEPSATSARPAGAVGAFTLIGSGPTGLGLAGLHLSLSAAVGFIAVADISVQNGVIMVRQVVEIARRHLTRSEAILDGAMLRLPPHRDDR